MINDPLFFAAALPAVIVLGIAKGGFGALNILVVPIMALAISPIQAAAILLPILILSDLVALYSYRGLFDRRTLAYIMPGAMAGIAIGWLTAAWVSEDFIRVIVGIVSIAFSAAYFIQRAANREAAQHSAPKGIFWGTIAGFTSFVSHAGGPPYQVYAAPLRLEPAVFAGTSIIAFAIMNAVKLVPYFFLGLFDTANLLTSAILLPVSIPATLFGVWLVKRATKERFYPAVYAIMLVVGVYLTADGLTSILWA